MAHIGYIRASSADKERDRQLDGIILDAVFVDGADGKGVERPALAECLSRLHAGDVLHVQSFNRLARNASELEKLIVDCADRGVDVYFHKEDFLFRGAGHANSNQARPFLFRALFAFADFERSLLRERQYEGRAAARQQGKVFGRPVVITPEMEETIWQQMRTGRLAADVARAYGVSRSSVYNIRRKRLVGSEA